MVQTKALYNLLRFNALEDPSMKVKPWALEDLRHFPLETLFSRLEKYGVNLDRKTFYSFSENCESPEELAELLLPDEEEEEMWDPFYLLVFELWRRLVPEKQSLSIFCDELDQRIFQYTHGDLETDELIQDSLANLLEILDENADSGVSPKEIIKAICDYCAHDVESFLYDYIFDLLDGGHCLYASELLEGFSPYVSDSVWFSFLRVRLLAFTDIGDANARMHRLLEEDLELSLLFEILDFLSTNAERELFKLAVKKTLPLLRSQEELTELIQLIVEFYQKLDQDEKEKAAQSILKKLKSGPVQSSDLKSLQELIEEPTI